MTSGDERDLVRRGYDALSYHYRSDGGHALFWARRQE
jgi:hypothetical protein